MVGTWTVPVFTPSQKPQVPYQKATFMQKLELLIRQLSACSSPPLGAVISYESSLAFHQVISSLAPREAGPHGSPGSYDLKRAYSNTKYLQSVLK